MKKTAVLWFAVLAILFAQTLQLCLHVLDAADAGHSHVTALHVESHFDSNIDGSEDASGDAHVAFAFTFVKKIAGDPLAVPLVAVVALLLFRPLIQFYWPAPLVAPASRGHRWRPPLRAPPR